MTATLADTIRAEAAARAEAEIREAEERAAIAAAFDASGFNALIPDFVHVYGSRGLYGSRGSLSFKDVAPDDALRLLDAFPPVACGYYRDGNTSTVAPIGQVGERYELRAECDGATLCISGGAGYGQSVKLDWHAQLDGIRLHMTAELVGAYLPTIRAGKVVMMAGEFIRYEGTDSLAWPLPADGCEFLRYSRGSGQALQHFTVYGSVRAYLERVAAKLDAENRETLASYERASAGLAAPRAATTAECEGLADWYGREKLRAGTLLQSATLRTDTAQAWEKVARDHWRQFAKARGLAPGRYGFDHYGFALWYLTAAGCLTDNGYKYGSAWL